MEQLLCPWEPSTYLFFSSNVPALVHYSHTIAVLAALVIALYVFVSNPRSAVGRLFFFLVTTFSIWTVLDLILWATNRPDVVMFSWSLQILLEPMTYVIAFYLYYFFLYKSWPNFRTNAFIAFLILPIVMLLPSEYNLSELYLSDCEAIEGFVAKYYTHVVHATLIICIAIMGAHRIPKIAIREEKLIALFFSFGLVSFLLAFSSGTIIGSLTDDWVLSQYGLFGMPLFAAFIAYCIIRFKAFNAKVITAELLIVSLGIGIVSLIALDDLQSVRIVAAITFVLVCAIGYILVNNVRREITQRELIEKQEQELEVVNKQQENLLHFISHEIKGFLTEGQNAFAGIVEGDYGVPPAPMKTLAASALVKMREGVSTVMNILDASNLKKGTVSYKKESVDLKGIVEDAVMRLRPQAEAKGLTLTLQATEGGVCVTRGDKDKLEQHVIRNLIDNAIKYTQQGSISVSLECIGHNIHFAVKDTGVGITDEDRVHLFTEGGHGKDSIKVNVDSTGYGLFIAKQVTEAHGGTIRAESEGAGKGSEFIVELPVAR